MEQRIISTEVWICREGKKPERIKGFASRMLSGEEVIPGVVLALEKLRVSQ